jgi:hypothetical protein
MASRTVVPHDLEPGPLEETKNQDQAFCTGVTAGGNTFHFVESREVLRPESHQDTNTAHRYGVTGLPCGATPLAS